MGYYNDLISKASLARLQSQKSDGGVGPMQGLTELKTEEKSKKKHFQMVLIGAEGQTEEDTKGKKVSVPSRCLSNTSISDRPWV